MKSIFITGAASGIGKAVAARMYSYGWHLGLIDIQKDPLEAYTQIWDRDRYLVQVADITNVDAVAAAFSNYMKTVEKLDVLFNCAGLLEIGDFESIDLQRHHQILDVNNKGMLNCCYHGFPYLKANPGSKVINMSSASSLYGTPGFASYSASKFWVRGFTEALNLEWERHGINVVDIEPIFVKTPMVETKEAPIVERFGIKLDVDDVAKRVFQAVTDNAIHHPIGLDYRVVRTIRKWIPDRVARALMKRLSGY